MYYNSNYGYWGYPYMPYGGYPMGEAAEYLDNEYLGDKPIPRGMKEALLCLQQIQFALVETNLYLDTHPTDSQALQQHNAFAMKFRELKEQFEQRYGPLTGWMESKSPWQYIKGPWPWEI